jgi:protein-disulfide isomerase
LPMKAAQAAFAAERQGKFWEFHEKLFENYNVLNDEKINEIARGLASTWRNWPGT